jgi:hypothetical protein
MRQARRAAEPCYLCSVNTCFRNQVESMLGPADYNDRGPNRASIIRLASATFPLCDLFSRLEGLSANARVDPGAKIAALNPFLRSLALPDIPCIDTDIRRGSLPKPYGLLRAQWRQRVGASKGDRGNSVHD